MDFKEAYQKMLEGNKVRRKGDNRYFYYDKKMKQFFYYISEKCFDRLIENIEMEDALAEDWEVVEETKSKVKVWKPKKGDKYYYIGNAGSIFNCDWREDNLDEARLNIGNCFKTEEDAKHMVEKLKVIKELQDFAIENRDEEISWEEDDEYNRYKYSIYFDYRWESIRINWTTVAHDSPFNLYFASKEIAQEAIKKIGEDRIKKYYFDIED